MGHRRIERESSRRLSARWCDDIQATQQPKERPRNRHRWYYDGEARRTLDRGDYYVICPDIDWAGQAPIDGRPLEDGFRYSSDRNDDWLTRERLLAMLDE